MTNEIPLCQECGQGMRDANQGFFNLQYGHPVWECINPECTRCARDILEKELAEKYREFVVAVEDMNSMVDKLKATLDNYEKG